MVNECECEQGLDDMIFQTSEVIRGQQERNQRLGWGMHNFNLYQPSHCFSRS